jgi:transposase
MTGLLKIDIVESVEELRDLMKQQETSLNFAKVQSLYLLKINVVETVRYLAILVGRSERTAHRWLSSYREGGIERLLWEPEPQGRPKKVSVEEVAMIQNELKDPQGFTSYKEVHFWASIFQGIEASYMTIYRLVKEELQAKLKVARPQCLKQLPGEVEAFKNNLPTALKELQEKESEKIKKYEKVRYRCQDESRFGCHTIVRRKITLKGVKPIGTFQYNFKVTWMYGAGNVKRIVSGKNQRGKRSGNSMAKRLRAAFQ